MSLALNDGECIVWQSHQSFVLWLPCVFWASLYGWSYHLPGILYLLSWIVAVLWFRSTCMMVYRYWGVRYVLTNFRFIRISGFFWQAMDSLYVSRWHGFEIKQSRLGRTLDYGKIYAGIGYRRHLLGKDICGIQAFSQEISPMLLLGYEPFSHNGSHDGSCDATIS